MIELFTHKQIRCKHCEFEFSFTGFGSAAKLVCPACGGENEWSPPPPDKGGQTAEGRRQTADGRRQKTVLSRWLMADSGRRTADGGQKKMAEDGGRQEGSPLAQEEEFKPRGLENKTQEQEDHTQEQEEHTGEQEGNAEERGGVSPPVVAPCFAEQCPLLTGDESGEAVAKQLRLKLRTTQNRKQTILGWTVTLQVSVLIGVALFMAQTQMMHKTGMFRTSVATGEPPITESPIAALPAGPHPLPSPPAALKEPEAGAAPPVLVTVFPESMASPLVPQSAEPENLTAWNLTAWNNVPTDKPTDNNPLTMQSDSSTTADMALTDMVFDLSPYEESPSGMRQDAYSPLMMPPGALAVNSFAEQAPPLPPPVEEIVLTSEMVDELLEAAIESLTTDPESSAEHAMMAVKICEQLKLPLPDSIYWILGNAFAALTWGEPLLESSPPIETMTLSPNSRYLIVQLQNRTVWLWDLQHTEQPGFPLDSGGAEYVKFVFTPDLRWIIGGQKDGLIRVWDMNLNNPAEAVIMLSDRVSGLQDMQISPNGQWLAAFGHAPAGAATIQNQPSHSSVQQVNYQHGGDRFGTNEASYPVLIWNLRQMSSGLIPMAVGIPSLPQPVQVIRFSPNSDRIAIGRKDTIVRVYDLTSRGVSEDPFVLRGHQLGITQIAFAPNGQWLATGSQDNTIRLWNLASSKVSTESVALYGHVGWISALTVAPSGEQIISGSYDGTMRIWNIKENRISTATDEKPFVLESELGVLESFLITRDGNKMVALGKEGSLGIYHFPSLTSNLLTSGNSTENFRAIFFRNNRLAISKCLITLDDQLLIFSYEHLPNPENSGIRLWPLYPQAFVE